MATPSQIRSERKKVLRQVSQQLRTLDSLLEKLQRLIARILKLKKRLPDPEDAIQILQQIRSLDQQLDKVLSDANTFSNFVKTT